MARILIVDDRPINREFLVTLLGYRGHALLEAADGRQALDIAESEQPDLIISDILMPTMDGYEFVRQLRARPHLSSIPVIFYTAHYLKQEVQALAAACGVAHILMKPSEPEVVLETVEAALGFASVPVIPSPPLETFDREHLRLLTDKLAQKNNELDRANNRLTALIELNLQLATEREPERLLNSLSRAARELIAASWCLVCIEDGQVQGPRYFFTSGLAEEVVERLGKPRLPAEIAALLLEEGRPFRLHSGQGDPEVVGLPDSWPPVHSFLAVPIKSLQETYGWLGLVDKLGKELFSEEDEHLAGILGAQVGRIYENRRLYVEVQQHAGELEREVAERKQAEEALAESQARLAGIINSAMDAIITIGTDQCIVLFNPAAEAMFGLPAAEAIGQQLDRIIPKRFREAHRQHIQVFGKTGITSRRMGHQEAIAGLRINGEEFPIEASISRMEAAGKQLFTVILRDVTNRIQAEMALHESEEKLRLFIEHAPAALAMFDREMRYLAHSRRWLMDYGLEDQSLVGHSHYAVFPEVPDRWRTVHRRALEGEVVQAAEDFFERVDGTVQWLQWEARPWYTADNSIGGVVIFTEDITERKKDREALHQSETQLQHIVDTVPEGVLLLAADGAVRLTNPMAEQYLTILAPDWENGRLTHLGQRPLNDFLTPPPQGLWHEIAASDYVFEAIARPVEVSPENAGWVLVMRDVTQVRDIQQRVQQQERLAAVGQLAAGIAHDFNNIMGVISLQAQLFSRTFELPPRAQERMDIVEQQALLATDLIQQILDFSRQSIMERQPLDLLPFTKEMVKLLKRTLPEHIQIELTYREEAYVIQADPSRIQQVMMNMAINARDAMPEGGQLHIGLHHVRTEEAKLLFMHELPPGNWIQIEITDSGSGIPGEVLSQIFEPFFTTKEVGKGTGLGLAQVYGIIQQHEGYIDVTTQVGQGTSFFLYLLVLDIDYSVAITLDRASLRQGQGQTVLLVEDQSAIRQSLASSLTFMDYKVIEATNGREALAILEAKGNDIALVLSDVVMPEMGGVGLFRAIQQQKLTIPVILLTGHPLGDDLENLLSTGLTAWLPKPPNLVNLSHLLAQVLDS